VKMVIMMMIMVAMTPIMIYDDDNMVMI